MFTTISGGEWSYRQLPKGVNMILGTDSCNQEIRPIAKFLSVHTNRHPNTNGTLWGWIDGCDKNICWSDDKKFNKAAAVKLVEKYNTGNCL